MKELEETITFLEQQIEKLKEIKSSNEIWKPKFGEQYYYLRIFLDIGETVNANHEFDYKNLEDGNYFQTEKEAEKYAEHFKQILKNREL